MSSKVVDAINDASRLNVNWHGNTRQAIYDLRSTLVAQFAKPAPQPAKSPWNTQTVAALVLAMSGLGVSIKSLRTSLKSFDISRRTWERNLEKDLNPQKFKEVEEAKFKIAQEIKEAWEKQKSALRQASQPGKTGSLAAGTGPQGGGAGSSASGLPSAGTMTAGGRKLGIGAAEGIAAGLRDGRPKINKAARELLEAVGNNPRVVAEAKRLGDAIGAGLAQGIERSKGKVAGAVRNVADQITRSVKVILQISSPSRLMVRMGTAVGDGLSQGIRQGRGKVRSAAGQLAKSAVPAASVKSAANRAGRQIGDGLATGISSSRGKVTAAMRSVTRPVASGARAAASGMRPLQQEMTKVGNEATKSGKKVGSASKGMKGLGPAGRLAGGGLKAVGAGFKSALGPAGIILMLLTPFIEKLVESVMKSKTFQKVVSTAMRGVSVAVKKLKEAALFVWNWIKDNWKKLPLLLLAPFLAVPIALVVFRKQIAEKIGAAINWIKDNWKRILGFLVSPFTTGVREVGRAFGKILSRAAALPGQIGRSIGNVAGTLRGKGAELINGFISGIVSRAGAVISAIKGFITDKIPGFVKNALGIRSPSVVMMGLGRNVGEGMALGIQDSAEKVDAAMETLVPAPATTVVRAETARAVAGVALSARRARAGERRYEFHFHGPVKDPEETSRQFASRLRAWEVLNAVR